MLRLLLVVTFIVLLSRFPCHASDYTQPDEPIQIADAGSRQSAEVMKQSDHHNRVNRQKHEREIEKRVAAIGVTETENRGLDNFVMIVLAVSAGALILLSSRMRGGRRRARPRRLPLR
jgi:hypothetical protein